MASTSKSLKRQPESSFTDLLASDDWEDALVAEAMDVKPHSTLKRDSSDTEEGKAETSRRRLAEENEDVYGVTGFGEGGKYMANKRKKLKVQNAAWKDEEEEETEALPQIFKGLRVYINGFTVEVGLRQMQELFIKRGGDYVPYLDKKGLITHIVASVLTPLKRLEFASYKVAHPNWLIESAKCGKLLDWKRFPLLPDAEDPMSRFGAADGEKDHLGTQTGQRTLFSMTPRSRAPVIELSTDSKGKQKEVDQTMETLGQRGIRLAQAALAQQHQQQTATTHSFFAPKPKSTSSSTSNSPKKPARPPPATTDSSTEQKSPYLPRANISNRTAALLNDPIWLAKNTSAGEDFLTSYFEQSRLHHLSTWKQELKTHVANLQPAKNAPVRKEKLTGTASDGRTIAHVDFDCFFVSAGLTTRPELRGRPVAVCHGGEGEGKASTSEIASCSYEARAKGVKNGMSLGRAREMCPEILTIPFEFELYKNIASKFYQILLAHADFLQAVSIDEVLIDITNKVASLPYSEDPAMDFAKQLRAEIFAATACEASIGLSHNILLARLASRKAKPANVFHLLPNDVATFMSPLGVDALPGIGWSMEATLEKELGIKTVGDILKYDPARLRAAIGEKQGAKFSTYAKGIDARELEGPTARGSVSAEVNYGIRFTEDVQVQRFMLAMGQEVSKRLKKEGFQSKHCTLKVMERHPDASVEAPKFLGHGWCNSFNVSWPIPGKATDDPTIIGEGVWKLLRAALEDRRIDITDLRGIGVMMTKLEKDGVALDLAREKGQSTLSFGAAPRKGTLAVSRPPPVASSSNIGCVVVSSSSPDKAPPLQQATRQRSPPPRITRSQTQLKKEPSIIVIDSDSDQEVTVPCVKSKTKLTVDVKPIIKKTIPNSNAPKVARADKVPKAMVPSIFKQGKKKKVGKVSDEELENLGIDSEYYHALPPDYQASTLAEARAGKGGDVKPVVGKPEKKEQALLTSQSQSSKVSLQGSTSKLSATPTLTQAELEELSSDDIRALGYDVETFRELGMEMQNELNKEHVARRKAFTVVGRAASLPARTAPRPRNGLAVKIIDPPKLGKAQTIDEIRSFLEEWVDTEADEGPEEGDVEIFKKFLVKVIDRKRGQDLAKACELITWLEMIVEDVYGSRMSMASENAESWWRACSAMRDLVQNAVDRDGGGKLVF